MIAWWANLFGRRRIQVDPDGAWAALRAGRLQEATDLLGQCRANGQDSPALNRLATHIGWQQHDLGAAAGLLETALRLLPDAPLRQVVYCALLGAVTTLRRDVASTPRCSITTGGRFGNWATSSSFPPMLST